jgi:hypothetical protein
LFEDAELTALAREVEAADPYQLLRMEQAAPTA